MVYRILCTGILLMGIHSSATPDAPKAHPVSMRNNSATWNAHVTYTYDDQNAGRSFRYTTIIPPNGSRILADDAENIRDISYYMNGTGLHRYKALTSQRHIVDNQHLTGDGQLIVDIIPTTQARSCLPGRKTTHGHWVVDEKAANVAGGYPDAIGQDAWKQLPQAVDNLCQSDRNTLFAYLLGEREQITLNKEQAHALLAIKRGYIRDKKLSAAALHAAKQQRDGMLQETYSTYVAPAQDTVRDIEQHNNTHLASTSSARCGGFVNVALGSYENAVKNRLLSLPQKAYTALATN